MAYALYECNRCEKRHDEFLKQSGNILKEVSSIDTENWDALKLVSALKVICYPEEEFEYDEVNIKRCKCFVAACLSFKGKMCCATNGPKCFTFRFCQMMSYHNW